MDAKDVADLGMQFKRDWLISGLVLISMILQLALVFGGAFRYRSSNAILTSGVWLAYTSADALAIAALTTMMQSASSSSSSNTQIILYALWAPLLLLHLGGPDTITAYSTPDNQLWLRHGFTMLYQISVAAYLICSSTLGRKDGEGQQWYLLAAAILVFIAGSTKYAERTIALRLASFSQIVSSTQPICDFMKHEHQIDRGIGQETDESDDEIDQSEEETDDIEKQFHIELRKRLDLKRGIKERKVEYNYIVTGERQFHKEFQSNSKKGNFKWCSDNLLQIGIVTIKDVWEYEGGNVSDNYILCVSHALFKMYQRRFAGLRFHEGDGKKTRRFFLSGHLNHDKVYKIVEMELKFIYDYFFSKSGGTAYSQWGTVMRLANTCLIPVACFFVFTELQYKRKDALFAQTMVTYILISVSFAVEVFQLCRITLSDWTMVWMICLYIRHFHLRKRTSCYTARLLKAVMHMVGKVRKAIRHENKYWENKIKQHSVTETILTSSPIIWRVLQILPTDWYLKAIGACHIKSQPIQDDFKCFMFEKLKACCNPEDSIVKCMRRICDTLEGLSALDHLILYWHVATTICEREDGDKCFTDMGVKRNIRFSGILSKYCAYLLLSCPSILPLHPENAKIACKKMYSELYELAKKRPKNATEKHINQMLKDYKSESSLGAATRYASELLNAPSNERWESLANKWAMLLIYIAYYNKATFHRERLTVGGEFLSQLWVLLGHMGCGEQWESAAGYKNETQGPTSKRPRARGKK